MKKFIAVFSAITLCFLLASCGIVGVPEETTISEKQKLNSEIDAISTDLLSFSELNASCDAFNSAFDAVEAYDNDTDGIYVDMLINKGIGFYNSYLEMSEEADSAAEIVGNVFAAERVQEIGDIISDASSGESFRLNTDRLEKVIGELESSYEEFKLLDPNNRYFTASATYAELDALVTDSINQFKSAIDFYKNNSLEADNFDAFKAYLSSASSSMTDFSKKHAQSLTVMSESAEKVLVFAEKIKTTSN